VRCRRAGGQSSRRRAIPSFFPTFNTGPFPEGDVGELLRIALASIGVSEDYQRQRLLEVFVFVHQPRRDGLVHPVERSAHEADGLGTVGTA
jgi:hypothetical protein